MDVQRLIGEVARRHNILVDPKDPILVTVTMNEVLLAEHVQLLQSALDRAQRVLEQVSRAQVEVAKQSATRLIADGGRDAAEQVRSAGSVLRDQIERLTETATQVAQATGRAAAQHERRSRWFAAVSLGSAIAAVGALAVLLARGS